MEEQRPSPEERERSWRTRMIAAQAGDRTAYDSLLRELLVRARRLVAVRVADAAAREDIVQNALVSIHRARHTWRPERAFTPWFHAVVRNAISDWERARARRSRREVGLDAEAMALPSVEPAEPFAADLSPELSRALASLPAAQREAVLLIHVDGLSVAEAAAQAGVSSAALKVRAHRGYRALRALLRPGDA